MRFRRSVEGRLGPVVDRDRPALSERWRLRVLVITALVCAAVFTAAFLVGLHHP
jgi:hypothetical protein